jgi:hypothetical protein
LFRVIRADSICHWSRGATAAGRTAAPASRPRENPLRDLHGRAEVLLREAIGCSIAVTLRPPGTVPRSEGGKL